MSDTQILEQLKGGDGASLAQLLIAAAPEEAALRSALGALKACAKDVQAALQERCTSAKRQKVEGDDEVLYRLENVQCHSPRGRFTLEFSAAGLSLRAKSAANDQFVPLERVSRVLRVRKPEAYAKKDASWYFVLQLKDGVSTPKGKPLRALLLQSEEGGAPLDLGPSLQGAPPSVLQSILEELLHSATFGSASADVFESSLSKKPFVGCYKGVQEGHLWPLAAGVLFLKPPTFVPEEDVSGLTCGRGGASGATRYVDLSLALESGETVEFTNIERDELPGLQAYIQWLTRSRLRANAEADRIAAAGAEEKGVESKIGRVKEEPGLANAGEPEIGAVKEEPGLANARAEGIAREAPGGRASRSSAVSAREQTRQDLLHAEEDDDDSDDSDDDFCARDDYDSSSDSDSDSDESTADEQQEIKAMIQADALRDYYAEKKRKHEAITD